MNKTHVVLAKEHSSFLASHLKQKSVNPLHYMPVHQNRLIAGANKIFTIIARLKHKKEADFKKLQKALLHEIEDFGEKIKLLGYDDDSVFVCCYALNACVEELLKTYAANAEGKIRIRSSLKAIDRQRFFVTLDKVCKEPQQFVEVIELVYICLSLGVSTRNRNDNEDIQQTVDSLYHIIGGQRGEVKKRLSFLESQVVVSPPLVESSPLFLSVFKVLLGTCLIIFGMYASTDYLFRLCSRQFSQELLVRNDFTVDQTLVHRAS